MKNIFKVVDMIMEKLSDVIIVLAIIVVVLIVLQIIITGIEDWFIPLLMNH